MNKIAVRCPICKKHLMNVDEKSQINKTALCRECNRTILFKVDTKTAEIIPNETRHCASGKKIM